MGFFESLFVGSITSGVNVSNDFDDDIKHTTKKGYQYMFLYN